ncbi:hypothetical protein [Neisseria polysaccharea]|uniref:hypothetical protein n=1 Tax=Neisseria polysaccharea TaxID=489 RepID=UPI0027E0A660|nr:hypothetical protein [Neisseria polysaccharea]
MAGRNGRVGFSPPLQTASALPVIPTQAGIQCVRFQLFWVSGNFQIGIPTKVGI